MNTPRPLGPVDGLGTGRFAVVTQGDLPEAWFLVEHLLERGQMVSVLRGRGQPVSHRLMMLHRLCRDHGVIYIGGVLVGRMVRSRYQSPEYVPFPEIGTHVVARLEAAVALHDTHDLHDRRSLAFLRAQTPDYILVAGVPALQRKLYTIARYGALHRHLGIAPLYRGSDCPVWTLAAGDFDHFGYTIHRVSSRVEGGEVLLQRRLPLVPGEAFGEALARVNRAGSEGFAEVVDALIDGHVLPGTTYDPGEGRHYPPAPLGVIRQAYARYREAVEPAAPVA